MLPKNIVPENQFWTVGGENHLRDNMDNRERAAKNIV